jgi:hypothetical protein
VWAELKYTKSSSTFHSWVDQTGRTYGLNFATQNDADMFSKGISDAVTKLKQGAFFSPPTLANARSYLISLLMIGGGGGGGGGGV